MIKYLELTAPEQSAFRQVKILSIECNEGDYVTAGSTLFRVKSGQNEIDLPSTLDGKVIEMIARVDENITLSTPLLLLETEVEGSTATPPITPVDDRKVKAAKDQSTQTSSQAAETKAKSKTKTEQTKTTKSAAENQKKKSKKSNIQKAAEKAKKHQQQMLNLSEQANDNKLKKSQGKSNPSTDVSEQTAPKNALESSPSVIDKNHKAKQSDSMPASSTVKISVPDIGTDSAKVIEILVNIGDQISIEDPLVTLESDKASMDVPSTHDGIVTAISVLVDQEVSEGSIVMELDVKANEADQTTEEPAAEADETVPAGSTENTELDTQDNNDQQSLMQIKIPDIGGDTAKVIEILVNIGDQVEVEEPLVTLESDKASMDVPSTHAGTIQSIEVSIDDEVSEGTLLVSLQSSSNIGTQRSVTPEIEDKITPSAATTSATNEINKPQAGQTASPAQSNAKSHASPSIRRFARELGVDLSKVSGSGRKNRVSKDDVKAFVKGIMNTGGAVAASKAADSGAGIPQIPAQDFSKFGAIDVQPLNRIKKLTAANLHRSWLNVPHVTHNDESNINDLESFRKQLNSEYAAQNRGIKLSPLAFIVKAMVNALQAFPQFNSSLEPGGENLIYKKYFNIGIAVETPNGLVVPVIKDADKKSVAEIAVEMGELAAKARDKKLTMNDMSGACITISSLGGIGGTGFTPIVNAPEVAILGVSRSKIQPVWNGSEFLPGMMLPLSLSYDHRVIDGAEAARFTRHIAAVLEDVRRLTV
jgi:pyruvate dehydrogenase E2 component (dihydrolipoamide acetyltransferase)